MDGNIMVHIWRFFNGGGLFRYGKKSNYLVNDSLSADI